MLQATHIHSGAIGTVIGVHAQRKAHIIKLPTGQHQYWKTESTQMEGTMDKEVIFKLTDKSKVIERYFDTAEEAAQYLAELTCLNHMYDKTDHTARLSNGWMIESNYNLRDLLKTKSEINKTLKKKIQSNLIQLPHTLKEPDMIAGQPKAKSKKTYTGAMIKLQDLTKDTRKARVILRGLVRNKKITKPSRWEWSEGSSDLEIVRAALKK